MAVKSMFFNAVQSGSSYDRVYSAEDFSGYLDKIVGDGVFADPSLNLRVIAANPASMNVVVYQGQGWIKGHKVILDQSLTLSIGAANASTRKDAVIMYLDHDAREMGFAVKAGTPGSSTPPALVQTATRWEYRLATVTVASGTTAISDAMITDERGTSVCPYVAGLVEQIDASAIYAQMQAQFEAWFETIQQQVASLTGSITGLTKYEAVYTTGSSNVSSFDVTTYVSQFNQLTDKLELYINGLRLNPNEYTLSGNTVTLATTITSTMPHPDITIVVWHVDITP